MRECWWTEVEVILEGKKSDSTNSARAEEDQKKESIHFNIAGPLSLIILTLICREVEP